MSTAPPDFRAPIDPSPEEAALAAAYARGRDDERRRATYHAHLLALKAFGAPVAYPAVLDMANAISSGKAAP